MKTREDLHRLVEELPEGEVQSAGRYLEYLRNLSDPLVSLLLDAPYDDEETSDREAEAAGEAWEEYLKKGGREWEQVRSEAYRR